MKTVAALSALVALASSHATFQQLWKNGEDLESTCARLPPSNSPIEDYTSDALQCNVNPAAASGKCSFEAGDTVTIEMHQHNSRSCTEEGIGGAHWGPVLAYMSKVEDAASADGSSDFFKVYQNTWKKSPGSSQGDADFWGTKDLNYNCGKLDFKIPTDIAPGDYLLRAEAIALHAASSSGGAQHYVTCYQLTVTGSGTLIPKDTVTFPSAYTKTGPGLGFSIHTNMDSYPAPGPALIAGGTEATPQLLTFGNIAGVPAATGGGAAPVASKSAALEPSSVAPVATSPAAVSSKPAEPTTVPEDPTTAPVNNGASSVAALPTSQASVTAKPSPVAPSTMATVVRPQPTGSASGDIKEYNQCGGQGFKGTGSCAKGLTCKEWNPYYFQCVKEDSGASEPVPTQPAAESPAPAQPEPTEVAPKDTTEKTYTLETFIAFLEQEAGSESASKIRRMIEALQM